VALVGYTNAGKTTLLNRLSGARLTAADQLFVTLDPAARIVNRDGYAPFIVTDTVGFVRKLPHELVAAFRATLEELSEAAVLLHVVDASHPSVGEHLAAVDAILAELEVADRPRLLVLNKIDRLDERRPLDALLAARRGVAVSAVTGEGLAHLHAAIDSTLRGSSAASMVLRIPHGDGAALALCYERGRVRSRVDEDSHVRIEVDMPALLPALAPYRQ
jgi:GTP-binding protein HflX